MPTGERDEKQHTRDADPSVTTKVEPTPDDTGKPPAQREQEPKVRLQTPESLLLTPAAPDRPKPPAMSTQFSKMLVDRDLFFERQDHAASVARMRRLLPIAIVLWLGFFSVDFVLATFVVPGDLMPYLILRLVGTVPIAISWARLRVEPRPSPRQLAWLDLMMTASSAGLLAGMCLFSGGLVSPYNSYIPLVLVGRAAVLPQHWKDGALRLGVPALMTPVVFTVAALVSEPVAAQFGDPIARGTFFFYIMLNFGAWLLLVIGGHNVWALRRQVFRSRSIGRYRLEERVGRGGMGEVWVAFHEQLKRKVALKILRPDSGTDPVAVARFEREIMATASLTHPNTVRIFDHGVTEDGLWYYAMELLVGQDLGSAVRQGKPMSPDRAVYLVRQAARALAEAHERGIIHRDIKPENLFITELGGEKDFVKVLDFGIAKLEAAGDDSNLTTTGFVAGTPAYVSPEVAMGEVADARSDVYGLGGTLYYAVTGTMPFTAHTSKQIFAMHVHKPVEPPSERRGEPLPGNLEEIILRCLSKAPDERFDDAAAVVAALDSCGVANPDASG